MVTTFRLPDDLKGEATAYAARAGVPLNALLKLALRTYLDAHVPGAWSATPTRKTGGIPAAATVNAAAPARKVNRAQRRATKKAKR